VPKMPRWKPKRIRVLARTLSCAVAFAVFGTASSLAQEPPTSVPPGGPPPAIGAIPFNGWLLYPTLDLFTQSSNNYFLNPQSKISGWGFGESPSMTAEWSNGIHTTTLYGNFNHIDYPTQNQINTNDGEATFTQRYAPLRDLSFTFLSDYTHRTIATGLIGSIPTAITTPSTEVLPNGNTVLPNGLIVSPNGQVVGQSNPAVSVSSTSLVNPYDQYTASAQVDKIFSDGAFSLTETLRRTNYEQSPGEDFSSNSLSGNTSFWLGPLVYAYMNGEYAKNDTSEPIPSSQVYNVVGGLGTRQFGLFRASAYYGHQGSDSSGSPWAGGAVYGAGVTYYPMPVWTVAMNVSRTINIAATQAVPSNFALTLPVPTPLQVSLSSSAAVTASTLSTSYKFSEQLNATGSLGYTHVQDIGSSAWDDAWLADVTFRYDLWRDLTFSLEYQYSSILSNVPFTTANRNLVTLSTLYKF
jgi:Putative beta-barrel porin 2